MCDEKPPRESLNINNLAQYIFLGLLYWGVAKW